MIPMTVLSSIISTNLIVSPFILLLLLTVPLIDKRYAPDGRCFIWLLVIAALCVPLFTVLPRPAFQINMQIPVISEYTLATENIPTTIATTDFTTIDSTVAQPPSEHAPLNPSILPALWLLGVFVSLSLRLVSYLILKYSLRRWSYDVSDERVLTAFENACVSLGVPMRLHLKTCKKITSPLLMGYFKPLVLIPNASYAPDEMDFMLRHELSHYKRHDLWYKLVMVAVTSVYWFNPLVHLMAAQVNKDLEAACDSLTVKGMDKHMRKRYSEIILNIAYKSQLHPHPMTTHFFGGKNMLKRRFSNIIAPTKQKGMELFAVTGTLILVVTLMVGFNFAVTQSNDLPSEESIRNESSSTTGSTELPAADINVYGEPSPTEADDLSNTFYKSNDIEGFVAALPYASEETKAQLLSAAFESGNVSFASAILNNYSGNIDNYAEAAYQSSNTSMFAVLINYITQQSIDNLAETAYQSANTAMFAISINRLSQQSINSYAEAAYQSSNTAMFSILMHRISQQERDKFIERAESDEKASFLAILTGIYPHL